MSPAVVEVRSSMVSPSSKYSSATLQHPDIKSHTQFDSSFSYSAFSSSVSHEDQQSVKSSSCRNSSEFGFKSASDSQRVTRSRPRLTKVRKRVASQHARSKVGSIEVGSSFSNSDCSNNEFGFSGDASKFESAGFVFGANRSGLVGNFNFGEREYTDNVQKELDTGKLENVEFVFGAEQSYRASSSDNNSGQSSLNCGTFVADDGVKMKVESKPQCERSDNTSFYFTSNLEHLYTNLTSNSEKRNHNELDSEVKCHSRYEANFLFHSELSVSSSILSSKEGESCDHAEKFNYSGGRTNMESENIIAMNNNVESVSVTDTIKLASTITSEEGELDKPVGKAGIDGRSNFKTVKNAYLKKSDDSNFVFGNSWFDAATNVGSTVSDFGVKMKAESIAECQKVEANNVNYYCKEGKILKEDLGGDFFIFRSSSLDEPMEERKLNHKNLSDTAGTNVTAGNLESNTDMNKFSTERNNIYDSVLRPNTIFSLPDEMKNLNINDSGNIDGYGKPDFSTATFAETSSSFGGCEKPFGASNGSMGNSNHCSEGVVGAIDKNTEDNSKSSGESKTELQSKFPSVFVGSSSVEPFNFSSGCSASCVESQFTQPPANKTSTTCLFSASLQCQPNDSLSGVPSTAEVEKNNDDNSLNTPNDFGTSTEFKMPQWDPSSFKENLFSDLNLESNIKSKVNKTRRSKKTRGNLKRTSRQDKVLNEDDSSRLNLDSPGSCTPMDFSPYQENLSVDQYSREMPYEFSHPVNSSAPLTPHFTACTDEKDGVFLSQSKGKDGDTGIWKYDEPNDGSIEQNIDGFSVHTCPSEGFDSRNGTICFSSKTEQCCSRGFVSVASTEPRDAFNSIADTLESNYRKQSGSEDMRDKSFIFSASTAIPASLSATKRHHRKKNRKKSSCDTFVISPNPDTKFGSAFEFSSFASTSSHSEIASKLEVEEKFKLGNSFSTAIQETCEKWRLRGNQAYKNGDLSKAEDLYTQGIDSVPSNERLASCLHSLMLCYSNRAATRISLGKIREALGDCEVASILDPNFLKVQVRAASCHLLLGEIENASQYFNKCLESSDGVCLDRRMIIEAADGLQKAQKVAECTKQSSELMEQKTDDSALSALNLIAEAISISLYSEKLLEMKAEALFMLRRYEEAIKLCEESLCLAEKNCIAKSATVKTDVFECQSHSIDRFWRWCLIAKAFFYLGKFEAALDMVGKLEREKEKLLEEKSKIKGLESSFTLANTIRELLHCKNAGNEAFRSGKYTEAVEHYTAALSINVQSRSFTAVCLCNRAASYQALGQIADAIADCSLAIALDENYTKAFSRRASLHEMIRDYGQAASDLQKIIFIMENQSDDKVKQSNTPNRSAGSVELKKARRNMPLMEEAAKKGISLDLYLILGVKATDTASDIKKAYRKAALRHHPDKAGQFLARSDNNYDGRLWKEISQDVYRDADRLFKIIGEAYAVLSDPNKRSRYDLEEDTRKAAKESKRGSSCRRSSDVYGSPLERNANGRKFRENWKSWGNSYSRW